MELFRNIFFNTDKVIENTDVKVTYAGKLFQDGAENVTVHYGFGENWEDSQDAQMQKTELGFQTNIHVKPNTKLNFCFKNGTGEWDNNNGTNYAFKIEKQNQYKGYSINGITTGTTDGTVGGISYGTTPTQNDGVTHGAAKIIKEIPYEGISSIKSNGNSYEVSENIISGINYSNSQTVVGGTVQTVSGNIYGINKNATQTINETAGTTQNTTSLCNVTTPTWGELIKKTFNNFVNYFSKLFSGNTGNVNSDNK